jgi:hypothetical protein
MIRLKMEYENEFGHTFTMENKVDVYSEFGNDILDEFARQINKFMEQIGYLSFNKDKIFLESVTEEEYDYLIECLDEYRENKEEND